MKLRYQIMLLSFKSFIWSNNLLKITDIFKSLICYQVMLDSQVMKKDFVNLDF